MPNKEDWDEKNEKNLKEQLLEDIQKFMADKEKEFHLKEYDISDLWPASDREKEENPNIIFSFDDFINWLRTNNLPLYLTAANTEANQKGKNRTNRDMVLRKRDVPA